uniref:Uncharacterized protein n=1 Tax=Mesocestoides corti TaxID=53468 RepID=A0A5K3FI50_MESCO
MPVHPPPALHLHYNLACFSRSPRSLPPHAPLNHQQRRAHRLRCEAGISASHPSTQVHTHTHRVGNAPTQLRDRVRSRSRTHDHGMRPHARTRAHVRSRSSSPCLCLSSTHTHTHSSRPPPPASPETRNMACCLGVCAWVTPLKRARGGGGGRKRHWAGDRSI